MGFRAFSYYNLLSSSIYFTFFYRIETFFYLSLASKANPTGIVTLNFLLMSYFKLFRISANFYNFLEIFLFFNSFSNSSSLLEVGSSPVSSNFFIFYYSYISRTFNCFSRLARYTWYSTTLGRPRLVKKSKTY